MKRKGSITVEAALLCPFLCLILCAMISFTLNLYGEAELFAEELRTEQEKELTSPELIRLEAVVEDLL